MDVDNLRKRLQAVLKERRIPAREASRQLGRNVGYVGDIISGKVKKPDVDEVLRLAEILDVEAVDLLGDSAPATARDFRPGGLREAMPFGEERRIGGRMIPLRAAPLPFQRQFVPFLDEPIGHVPAPWHLLDSPDAFAAMVPNNAHAPRFNAGETVYVDPAKSPAPGTSAWVRKKDGTVAICRLASIGAESVHLIFFGLEGEEHTAEVPFEDLEALKKIVAVSF